MFLFCGSLTLGIVLTSFLFCASCRGLGVCLLLFFVCASLLHWVVGVIFSFLFFSVLSLTFSVLLLST